jgi:hypothetical protein
LDAAKEGSGILRLDPQMATASNEGPDAEVDCEGGSHIPTEYSKMQTNMTINLECEYNNDLEGPNLDDDDTEDVAP